MKPKLKANSPDYIEFLRLYAKREMLSRRGVNPTHSEWGFLTMKCNNFKGSLIARMGQL